MVTKSKNISYSTGLKITATFLIWLSFMCIIGSSFFLLYFQDELQTKSYQETNQFKDAFGVLVYNSLNYAVLNDVHGLNGDAYAETIAYDISLSPNFMYYIKNRDTQKITTNVVASDPLEQIEKQTSAVHYSSKGSNDAYLAYYYQFQVKQMLQNSDYEVHAAIQMPPLSNDGFYRDWRTYNKVKLYEPVVISLLITCLIFFIIFSIYLLTVIGRREKHGTINLLWIDRLYTDVHFVFVIVAAFISMALGATLLESRTLSFNIIAVIIFGIDIWIGISYISSMIRQFKARQLFKNSFIYKTVSRCKKLLMIFFNGKGFKPLLLFMLLGYGAINSFLFAISLSGDPVTFLFFGFIFVLFNLIILYRAAKSLISLAQIIKAAQEISGGNLEYPLVLNEISPALLNFASNIKTIQGGLKNAVEEALKGERMKTALITNVSHDLKTPLTSIITYVDLLKMEALENPKALEYITVLEEKSDRMKRLVEDLIEASKATSGNLDVQLETVDLYQLVQQACGEYADRIDASQLDFRLLYDETDTTIQADGRHLWRIIDNLFTNVLKYTLQGTRVYIELKRELGYQFLTIKNISTHPLNLSPEQLTERFVRGDASRSTEGSGLGLSIAQSLTSLMGGHFKIEIDGDLFKVVLTFPIH